MADNIGDRQSAIAAAAERAGLDRYTVEVFRPRTDGPVQFVSQAAYVASDAPEKELVSPATLTGIGTEGSSYGTFLMVPPGIAYPDGQGAYLGAGAYDNSTATEPTPPAARVAATEVGA
jgi:hypothetical protein